MPNRMWKHRCSKSKGLVWKSVETCHACGELGEYDGWHYGMHEKMWWYQQRYGLKPIGPHRPLADKLFHEATSDCPECGGRGLLDVGMGKCYATCPSCKGAGHFFRLSPTEIQSRRRQVLAAYPDAAVHPTVGTPLAGVLVLNHQNGRMECISPVQLGEAANASPVFQATRVQTPDIAEFLVPALILSGADSPAASLEFLNWATRQTNLAAVWASSRRGDWMLWMLDKAVAMRLIPVPDPAALRRFVLACGEGASDSHATPQFVARTASRAEIERAGEDSARQAVHAQQADTLRTLLGNPFADIDTTPLRQRPECGITCWDQCDANLAREGQDA